MRSASAPAVATGVVPGALFPAARQRNIASRAAPAPTARWRGWYSYCRSSGFHIAAAPRVYSPQRPLEVLRHPGKRQFERCTPSDQHIIMSGAQPGGGESRTISRRRRRTRLRSTALPTFFDTVKPKRAGPLVATIACLQHESGGGCLRPGRRGQKIRPLPQSFHESNARSCSRRQADSRLRPRPRRADKTLRPPLVAMRARKPCRRLRTSLLG